METGDRRFKVDTSKGIYNGSVTKEPIFQDKNKESELRLEYVVDKDNPEYEIFWLMWYDSKGNPRLPGSAVFSKEDLLNATIGILNASKNIEKIK